MLADSILFAKQYTEQFLKNVCMNIKKKSAVFKMQF